MTEPMTEPGPPEVDTTMGDPSEGQRPPGQERTSRRVLQGRALRLLRITNGLTQRELASRTTLAKATISEYERGEREIGLDKLQQLLGAFGLPLTTLETACRMVERLDSGRAAPDIEEMAREVGETFERLVRWFAMLSTAREVRP